MYGIKQVYSKLNCKLYKFAKKFSFISSLSAAKDFSVTVLFPYGVMERNFIGTILSMCRFTLKKKGFFVYIKLISWENL